jgi:hypothetical protein
MQFHYCLLTSKSLLLDLMPELKSLRSFSWSSQYSEKSGTEWDAFMVVRVLEVMLRKSLAVSTQLLLPLPSGPGNNCTQTEENNSSVTPVYNHEYLNKNFALHTHTHTRVPPIQVLVNCDRESAVATSTPWASFCLSSHPDVATLSCLLHMYFW